MNLSNSEKIKKTVKEFFDKMGFEISIEIKPPQELTIPIDLIAKEPQVLIGKNGETLFEIQRLLKLILKKAVASEKNFYLDIDINEYKKKKREYLKELARMSADEVFLSKEEKELSPMNSYERRIIHSELSLRGDVTTGSIGEGIERRIMIKPV